MAKYTFDRLGPARFQHLAQALLEKIFRPSGDLVQFGDGKDGAREATWTQLSSHATYTRPANAVSDVPKHWVFQVKYHDIALRGWDNARIAIEQELDKELDKLVRKHKVPCHKFVLITNVPFTGVRNVGTRDKVADIIESWKTEVPEIVVWDAADISRMLDADIDVRSCYLDDILPGDILRAILTNASFKHDRLKSACHAYLKAVLRGERDAKSDEAGDESGLPLEKIYIDLDLTPVGASHKPDIVAALNDIAATPDPFEVRDITDPVERHIPLHNERIPASFAFLRADYDATLLRGGPGEGKSTITQFLALYHASRLVDPHLARVLAARLKLTGGVTSDGLDAHCRVRFPFRVELRRYAQWIAEQNKLTPPRVSFLASYLVERMNRMASADLTIDDLFSITQENPILLMLDGLDEVPNSTIRATIFAELQVFLDRCEGEQSDVALILSSRPRGYRGEFDGFEPIVWQTNTLASADFDLYADAWLEQRLADDDERADAKKRIDEGMKSVAVQQLATTLLQATVMLTIARRKHAIPHARHQLFQKYVEVMFDREQLKETVREHRNELLRLHERIGYEILRKMERPGGGRTLRNEEFRAYVREIIANYGSVQLRERTIDDVVEEIVLLAKDRLYLLVGEGDTQEEVDFAIHQFREYFAASYLSNHEEADVNRVYSALVSRSHYWGDVLQFYAARQNKAQQTSWIGEADGVGFDVTSAEDFARLVRTRRMLLRLLPEFGNLRNQDIKRSISHIFDRATRWTWSVDASVTHPLKAFAGGHREIIEEIFVPLSKSDVQAFAVEVGVLMALGVPAKSLDAIVDLSLRTSAFRAVFVELVFENNLECDLTSLQAADFTGALSELWGYMNLGSGENIWSHLTPAVLVELLIVHGYSWLLPRTGVEPWIDRVAAAANWLWSAGPDLLELGERSKIEVSIGPFANYDRSIDVPVDDAIEELAALDGSCGRRVASLLRLWRDDSAEVIASDVPRAAVQDESTEALLDPLWQLGRRFEESRQGASLTEFKLKQRTATSSDALSEFRILLVEEPNAWLALLFHPATWDELLPIISAPLIARLKASEFARFQILEPSAWFRMKVDSWHSPINIPFELCCCAISVVRKFGSEAAKLDWLTHMEIHPNPVTAETANSLLTAALDTHDLPWHWMCIILRQCATVRATQLDVSKMVALWQRMSIQQRPLFPLQRAFTSDEVMASLMSLKHIHADSLSAWLTASYGGGRKYADGETIIRRLSDHASDGSVNFEYRVMFAALMLGHSAHASEMNLWLQPEVVRALDGKGKWYSDRIGERFQSLAASCATRDDAEQLQMQFFRIVQDRGQYPDRIGVKVVEALLKLDESIVSPLKDEDWLAIPGEC